MLVRDIRSAPARYDQMTHRRCGQSGIDLVGASSVAQLEENLAAVSGPAFTAAELTAIDEHTVNAGVAV